MALSIKSPEADRLARQLAATTGESITVAVIVAMRERLAREEGKKRDKAGLAGARPGLAERLMAIGRHCASLPVLDPRSPEEVEAILEDVRAIIDHCSSLPILDHRSEDEIMGWDENGLPS
jgi:antitoxin VapB